MIDADALNVWNEQRLVGYLWRNTVGEMGFSYDAEWVAGGGFAVSHTLPLGAVEFDPETQVAHRFFANLLPEGGARERLVRDLKIANTDFALLRAVGGECAGALSILPVEQQPLTERRYHRITDKELAGLVMRRGQHYGDLSPDKRPRLSLAGAQDKCPVLLRDGNYLMPQGEAPSSHILKFEVADYRHVPAFEVFTTLLAGKVGLPVVDMELRQAGKSRYALIARYDRQWQQGDVRRLHQEDFCQALGYGYEKKYQEDGGPSFAQCLTLLRRVSSDPIIDVDMLLRWQVFNVLAGNSDGHGKNLSLLYLPDDEIRLAPFYDLVCTRAIERIDYRLAMAVGGERDPGIITREHWEVFAKELNVQSRFLANLVKTFATALLENLAPAREAFTATFGEYAALQRVEQVVKRQCQRTLSGL